MSGKILDSDGREILQDFHLSCALPVRQDLLQSFCPQNVPLHIGIRKCGEYCEMLTWQLINFWC